MRSVLDAVLKDQARPVVGEVEYSADGSTWAPVSGQTVSGRVSLRVGVTGPVTSARLLVGGHEVATVQGSGEFSGSGVTLQADGVDVSHPVAGASLSGETTVRVEAFGRNNDARADDDASAEVTVTVEGSGSGGSSVDEAGAGRWVYSRFGKWWRFTDGTFPVNVRLRIDGKVRREHPGLYVVQDNTAHMANLSVYVSSYVNGVAEIHSRILKEDLFKDWYNVFPERFQNKTNGVTPRRWIGLCNPELTQMIRYRVGGDFLKDLDRISRLKDQIDDDLVKQFNCIKRKKKEQLCAVAEKHEGIKLNPAFIFDVQVKRLHEYKRQLLNILSIVDIYFQLKDGKLPDFHPTVYLFGAKSAPGYARAKAIIRYINRVAKMINNDPAVNDKLKVVFVQNYNCSYAEHIIPAADISEQISPAGTEASGTGNMKLMLNGAVTLGTMDGANVEIVQEAGQENNYIFGATVEQINAARDSYYPRGIYDTNPGLHRAIDTLVDGTVPTDDDQRELYHALLDGASWHRADHYFLLMDYASYLEAKRRANKDYADRMAFGRKCLVNVASGAKFSSDRTIRQYANEIWHIEPTRERF